MKFGFDGSGSHAIYNQKNNEQTNNMIMTMFCPLRLTDSSNNIIFQQPLPNSTLSQRVLCLQMGKESLDSLQSLQMYNPEIHALETIGIDVHAAGQQLTLRAKVVSHMLDGKAAKLYTGLGGAYCDLCHLSKKDSADSDIIEGGFRITRDISEVIDFFADEDNTDEDGQVKKKKDDYETRAGITQKPIADQQVLSTQVLHTLLRTFDHFMEVVVHTMAGVFTWSASSWESHFLDKAKVNHSTNNFYNLTHSTKTLALKKYKRRKIRY